MRIPMDAVGRVVVPKRLRESLGLSGPTELEVVARDGVIELTAADLDARVEEHDGVPVIVSDSPARPLGVEDVRAAIERTRR